MKITLSILLAIALVTGCSSTKIESARPLIIPGITAINAVTITGADLSANELSPVLLKLMGDFQLSDGTAVPEFDNCRAGITVTPNFVTSRIYGRLENVSCILPNGNIVDKRVSGYIVDYDGKAGIKADSFGRNKPQMLELNAGENITVILTESFVIEGSR